MSHLAPPAKLAAHESSASLVFFLMREEQAAATRRQSDGEDVCAFCFQEESNSWDAAAAFINARARGEKARIEIKDNTTGFPPDLYGIRRSRLYAYGVNALAHFYTHRDFICMCTW